jgi:ABC-2 type transport system ATP-binding protein
MTCSRATASSLAQPTSIDGHEYRVVHARRGEVQTQLIVQTTGSDRVPSGWESHPVGLEELALAYLARTRLLGAPSAFNSIDDTGSEVTR